jgi:hypothetical protein
VFRFCFTGKLTALRNMRRWSRKVAFFPLVNISPFVRIPVENLRRTLSVDFELHEAGKSLCLFKQRYVNAYGGMEVQLHAFVTAAHYGQEYPDSRLGYYTLAEGSLVPIVGNLRLDTWASQRDVENGLSLVSARNRTQISRYSIS